jgi:hypothetical protein
MHPGSNSQRHAAAGRISPDEHMPSDTEDYGADPVSNDHREDHSVFAADPLAEGSEEPLVYAYFRQSIAADHFELESLSSHDTSDHRVSVCRISSPQRARRVRSSGTRARPNTRKLQKDQMRLQREIRNLDLEG